MTKVHKSPHIIVAHDLNRGIGLDNSLPWEGQLPDDMKHFRAKTLGNVVLMGRTTYESIGQPLPGRENRVLTRQTDLQIPGCKVFTNPMDALLDDYEDDRQIYVIGGAEVYELYTHMARFITSTEIEYEFNADTYFPAVEESEWVVISKESFEKNDRNKYDFSVVTRLKKPKYIDPQKARSAEQYEQFRQIELDGICPFCSEYLEVYHDGEVNERGDAWNVISNMIPYSNTDTHLVVIPSRHVESPSDLTKEEWESLQEVIKKYIKDMPYGGIAMRFGDTNHTAASVSHLHVHILKPKETLEKDEKVQFKISR